MKTLNKKGNEIFVIGGWDGIGNGLTNNESYKVSKDSWTTTHPPMPPPERKQELLATAEEFTLLVEHNQALVHRLTIMKYSSQNHKDF